MFVHLITGKKKKIPDPVVRADTQTDVRKKKRFLVWQIRVPACQDTLQCPYSVCLMKMSTQAETICTLSKPRDVQQDVISTEIAQMNRATLQWAHKSTHCTTVNCIRVSLRSDIMREETSVHDSDEEDIISSE